MLSYVTQGTCVRASVCLFGSVSRVCVTSERERAAAVCSVGRPCSVCVVCGPVVGPIDLVLIIRFRERSTAESGGLGERHSR